MVEITADMVKKLRERTGLGMMECKKALIEAQGDMNASEDLLRIKSGAKASKAAGRVAAEGVIGINVNHSAHHGALVEVNCETDFVARNEDFLAFAHEAARLVVEHHPEQVSDLMSVVGLGGDSLEEKRKALVMKLGENISVRRFECFATKGTIAYYVHGSKIGVMVNLQGGDGVLGRDIAMHIAASRPVCVSKNEVPADLLVREREIYTAQAAESGKPADIVVKMVEGRVQKFLAEVTLLGQPYVKNPDQTVEQLLKSKGAEVLGFQMYQVGEGIEKKTEDFAAEVAAAAGTSQAAR